MIGLGFAESLLSFGSGSWKSYTEEEIQVVKEETTLKLEAVECKLKQLEEDCERIQNGYTYLLINDEMRELKSLVETFKFQINLINSGYRGSEKIWGNDEASHIWVDQ